MFGDIKVLIAVPDQTRRTGLASFVETLGFDARTCPDVHGAMDILDCDILLLDTALTNGSSAFLLERWKGKGDGPVAVLMHSIEVGDRVKWMRAGAWNILVQEEDEEVLGACLHRYGEQVMLQRDVPQLKAQVAKMMRLLIIFGSIALILAGERAVEFIRLGLSLVK